VTRLLSLLVVGTGGLGLQELSLLLISNVVLLIVIAGAVAIIPAL